MELIKITEQNGKRAVSARELHSFLESKRDFSNWIKDRIEKYGFIENQDFALLNNFGEQTGRGGHNKIEYALTIDCAKELAMVEGNEKGKQARRYFIECERKMNQTTTLDFSNPDTVLMLAQNWKNEKDRADSLQIELKEVQPLVNFAKALQISEHNILIGEMAKILKQNSIEIGQNRLFDWLRDNSYLMKQGEQRNLPTQRSLELKLFEVKTTTINNPDGSVRVTKTTKVTPRGQEYFINKFMAAQVPSVVSPLIN